MRNVLELIHHELQNNAPVVSAVILSSTGSTPRSTGSRMAIARDGRNQGTVGGGPGEALAQRKAAETFQDKCPSILQLDLTGEQAAEAGMICGGRQDILLEYIAPTQENATFYGSLLQRWDNGQSALLYTAFTSNGAEVGDLSRALETDDLTASAPVQLKETARTKGAQTRLPFLVHEAQHTILIEPLRPSGTVVIAGAGHVGKATADCAALVGYETVVLDDRKEFLHQDRFPPSTVRHHFPDFGHCFNECRITPETAIVIVTRGHVHDKTVLDQALQTPAGYIGMIGSRKKRDAIYAALIEAGWDWKDLERVHCPIGLSIGADTPEEIAVSIVGELIQHRSGGR